MSEMLKISKSEGKVTVLHLDGNLDGQTEKELLDTVKTEYDAGNRSLVLDFASLKMITSAGLRALHVIYKMYTPAEEIQAWSAEHKDQPYKSPYFKIAQPSSDIHYILSISGFLQNIYIYPKMQEAVDSFS